VTRFKHFLLAAAGLAVLALAAGAVAFGPALAQTGGRDRTVPVVITDAQGDTASIDRQGSLAVEDPRLTFTGAGLLVHPGDRCCPRPSQRFDMSVSVPVGHGMGHGTFWVPPGKALLVYTLSTTGRAALWRNAPEEELEELTIPFPEQPATKLEIRTAHANFPTGLVFRAGEELTLNTFGVVNVGYDGSSRVHGVLVDDE
jgi:hypothetical protein